MSDIRILLVDDHPTFREGLCRFLEEHDDLKVIAKTGDGEEAIRLTKELRPDVAIIDVAIPKMNGIEATRQIKASCPKTAILMVSAFGDESYLLASLRAGAAGYIMKNATIPELISAVRMVNIEEAVFDLKTISKSLGLPVADEVAERRDRGPFRLRRRELEVLKLAANGISNREIAKKLGISERTIQTHMANIFKNLGVSSRTEAVTRALREGLLTIDDLP